MTGVGVRLRPITAAAAADLVAGRRRKRWHPEYPLAASLDAAGMFLQTAAVVDPGPWGIFWIRVDGEVVGDVGFHGPPAPRTAPGPVSVEIGYSVVPARRGLGVASAACRLVVDLAWRHGADEVRAETSVENLASQHVLQGRGFRAVAPTPAGELRYVLERPR